MTVAWVGPALTLFEALLDLGPAEREAALLSANPEIAKRVREMLAADESSRSGFGVSVGGIVASAVFDAGPAPERIGRYKILARLGAGGMGAVFEAEQEHPRRLVALKTLRPTLATAAGIDRFQGEILALARLLHPNIPQIYEAGQDTGVPFLVMELVRGVRLDQALADRPRRARVEVLVQICRAVEHAHAAGVLHRDLKPSNVLVTPEGQAKVLDFGLASLTEADRSGAVGTLAYASPEQLRGEPVDARTDVFGLGMTARAALLGPVPEPTDVPGALAVAQARASCRQADPTIDADLAAVLDRAVHPEVGHRTPSVAAMRADLERWLAHRPVLARRSSWVHRAGLWSARNRARLLSGIGAAAAVLAVAGGVYAARMTWAAWDRQAAEAEATRAWDAARARFEALSAAGQNKEADALFRAFADAPRHRGTRSVTEAWLSRAEQAWRAERLDEALESAGEAYTVAVEPDHVRAALVIAAEVLHVRRAWGALSRVLDRLDEHGGSAQHARYARWRRSLAMGLRDVDRAAVGLPADDPAQTVVRLLRNATRVAVDPEPVLHLHAGGLDGDRDVVRAVGLTDHHVLERSPSLRPLGVVTGHPGRAPWYQRLPDGRLLSAWRGPRDDGLMGIHLDPNRLDPGPPAFTFPVDGLATHAVADLDLDGKTETYLGLGAYGRQVLQLVEDPPQVRSVSSQLDLVRSDVVALEPADLDADGVPELLALLGPWRAWDLRVLVPDGAGGLKTRDRLPVGSADSLHVSRHDGRDTAWILRSGAHFRSRLDVVRDPPAILAVHGGPDGLRQRAEILLPERGEKQVSRGVFRDLNPDGRVDVVYGTTDGLAIGVQYAEDQFFFVHLAGVRLIDALNLDDDPEAEVVVDLIAENERWVLGAGDARLPVLPTPTAVYAPDGAPDAWKRAYDLDAMSLSAAGGRLLEALAPGAPALTATAHADAAAMYTRAGRHPDARRLIEPLMTDDAPERWRRIALEAGSETRSWRLAADAARALAPTDPGIDVAAWEAFVAPQPTLDLRFDQPLAGWQIHEPRVVRRDHAAGHLRVVASTLHDVAMDLPVDVRPGAFAIDLDLTLDVVEIGSHLSIRVAREGAAVELQASASGGSTGFSQEIRCGDRLLDPVFQRRVRSAEASTRLRARLEVLPDLETVRCTFQLDDEPPVRQRASIPRWTPGPARLEIRAEDPHQVEPGATLETLLGRVTLHAAALGPLDPDPRWEGRRWLAEGRPDRALPMLGQDEEGRAIALLDLRDPAAPPALVALGRSVEWYGVLLRARPDTLWALKGASKPGWYIPLYAGWHTATAHHETLPGLCAALRDPLVTLDEVPKEWEPEWVLFARARCHRLAGAPWLAHADLDTFEAWTGKKTLRDDFLRAQLYAEGGEPDLALAWMREVFRTSETPELLTDALVRDPVLGPLWASASGTEPSAPSKQAP